MNQLIQILYEISMSIGTTLDLNKMVKTSLATFMKKLDCSAGAVYRISDTPNGYTYKNISIIPRNIDHNLGFQHALSLLPTDNSSDSFLAFQQQLPINNQHSEYNIYILDLPDFGVLILVNNGTPFSPQLLRSFDRLQERFAIACKACLKEQALAHANKTIEATSQAKSEFLANISHEFRTPLNAVLGYTQILSLDKTLTNKQHNHIEIIHQNSQHLLTIIDDILEIVQIENNNISLQLVEFHLPLFLNNLVEVYRLQAEEKGIVFSYEVLTPLPITIENDPKRLRQILTNLLGNAIKFTSKGQVVLRVYSVDLPSESQPSPDKHITLCFEVEDTGIGLSEQQLAFIFQPFEQVDGGRGSAKGTGLGLTISQRLCEMLGCQIRIESRLEQGSKFWFDLTTHSTHHQTIIINEVDNNHPVHLPATSETTPLLYKDIIAPPLTELGKLFDLAIYGDMNGLLTALDKTEIADKTYFPFCRE